AGGRLRAAGVAVAGGHGPRRRRADRPRHGPVPPVLDPAGRRARGRRLRPLPGRRAARRARHRERPGRRGGRGRGPRHGRARGPRRAGRGRRPLLPPRLVRGRAPGGVARPGARRRDDPRPADGGRGLVGRRRRRPAGGRDRARRGRPRRPARPARRPDRARARRRRRGRRRRRPRAPGPGPERPGGGHARGHARPAPAAEPPRHHPRASQLVDRPAGAAGRRLHRSPRRPGRRGPPPLMPADRYERDTSNYDRALSFFDVVYGFSLTLLVTTLDVTDERAWRSPGELLRTNGSQAFSFALSFVVIVVFWRSNHALVARFAREALGGPGLPALALPPALYAVNVGLAVLANVAMFHVAVVRGLVEDGEPPAARRARTLDALVVPAVMFASVPVTYLGVDRWGDATAGKLVWLSLVVLGPLSSRLAERRAARAVADQRRAGDGGPPTS